MAITELLMSSSTLNVLDLKQEKIRLLHLSWFAFFLSFVVWFNFAPMLSAIKEAFDPVSYTHLTLPTNREV